ncbi:MAG: hypothetical protein AB7I30_11025 [Isosphaeraceae bacterium]
MKIDVVVEDSRGREVLLVAVNAGEVDEEMARSYLDYLRSSGLPARFGMVVNLEWIRIVDFESGNGKEFGCVLSSPQVLSIYDPEFGKKRIFPFYLATLVEAWLRDLVYRWNSPNPPALERLARLGLAQLIEGGDTRREVRVETHPVS